MIQSPKTILHECGTVSRVKVSQPQQLLELKPGLYYIYQACSNVHFCVSSAESPQQLLVYHASL